VLCPLTQHLSARSKLTKTRRRVLEIRIPRGRKMTTHEHIKIITENRYSNKKASLNRLKLTIKTINLLFLFLYMKKYSISTITNKIS